MESRLAAEERGEAGLSPGSGGRASPLTEELERVWTTGVEDKRGGIMGF